MKKFGVVGGSKLTKSGKFVVRVPKTLHYTLEMEAQTRGRQPRINLPSPNLRFLSKRIWYRRRSDHKAFNEVHEGHSTDWIVVNAEFNARFLEKCADLGLTQPPCVLNHSSDEHPQEPRYIGQTQSDHEALGLC